MDRNRSKFYFRFQKCCIKNSVLWVSCKDGINKDIEGFQSSSVFLSWKQVSIVRRLWDLLIEEERHELIRLKLKHLHAGDGAEDGESFDSPVVLLKNPLTIIWKHRGEVQYVIPR